MGICPTVDLRSLDAFLKNRGMAFGESRYGDKDYQLMISHSVKHAHSVIDTENESGDGFSWVDDYYGSNPISMYLTGPNLLTCLREANRRAYAIQSVGVKEWEDLMGEFNQLFYLACNSFREGVSRKPISPELQAKRDDYAQRMEKALRTFIY
jgi:hypothetical protein